MPAKRSRSSLTFSRHVAPFVPLALALTMGARSGLPPQTSAAPDVDTAASGFSQTCASPRFPIDAASPIDGTSCTVSGNGGAETWQNEAKNNFCATGENSNVDIPVATTLAEFVALQDKAQQISGINFGNTHDHPLTSTAGPVQNRTALVALGEGTLVQLQGFVKIARPEGKESVNCGVNVPDDPVYHDVHISIVSNSADQECSGIVVEMTPHHRPSSWSADVVNKVAQAGLMVRVTGQRMFDSTHTPCINGNPVKGDPARVSLWEIHPIYNLEVCPQGNCSAGGWIPLEAWNES